MAATKPRTNPFPTATPLQKQTKGNLIAFHGSHPLVASVMSSVRILRRSFKVLLLLRCVGAQWELRQALAFADQSLGHYDASMRAHVQRRFPPGDRPFRQLFEPEAAVAVLRRSIRRETVDPSGLRPACREEAESRTGATEFCRSTPRRASHRRALDAGGNARSGGGRSRPSPSDLRPRAALSDVGRACPSASSTASRSARWSPSSRPPRTAASPRA